MTLTEARRRIRALGLRVTYRPEYREFELNYRPADPRYRGESTAYFTNDRSDAVETAKYMARQPDPTA